MFKVLRFVFVLSLLMPSAGFCMEVDEKSFDFVAHLKVMNQIRDALAQESCAKHMTVVDLFMEGCPILTLLHNHVDGDVSVYCRRFMAALSSHAVKTLMQDAHPDDLLRVDEFMKEFSRPGQHRLSLHFQLSDIAEYNPAVSSAMRRIVTEIVELGLTKMFADQSAGFVFVWVANFVSMLNCSDLNEMRQLVRNAPDCDKRVAKIVHYGRFRKTHDLKSMRCDPRFVVADDGGESRPYEARKDMSRGIGPAKL